MKHNKDTEFVMYVDNFLSIETLESLQETFINLKYSEVRSITYTNKRLFFPTQKSSSYIGKRTFKTEQ